MPKLKLPAFLSRLNTKGNKRKLLGLIAIVLVAVIAWFIYSNNVRENDKLLADVAGHKIYQQEVKDFTAYSSNVNEKDATEVLANKYLLEALAKEQGISVSDQEITEQFGTDIKDKYFGNNYGYQYQVNELYMAKLAAHNEGIYKGKYVVAHFSRYVPYDSPVLADDKAANPKIGNEAAIAKDREYAEQFINGIYDQIKSGKLSFEQAAKIEKRDSVVGEKIYPALSHSGSFNTSISSNGLVVLDSTKPTLNQLNSGDISKPFVVKVSNSANNDSTAESYFLVVQMDEKSGGGNTDFSQYIEEAKQRLGYKIYV